MTLTTFEDYDGLTTRAKEAARDILQFIQTFRTSTEMPDTRRVKSAEIERIFSLSGTEVRSLVSAWRCAGLPIGSDYSGYFWAESFFDIKPTIDHIEQRALRLEHVARSLRSIRFSDLKQIEMELR